VLSLKQFIVEGNEIQQRVNKHLTKGRSVGTISPEGPHTDTPEKTAAAHKQMQGHLEAARKAGHIGGWSGPHKGQYQYGSGAKDVAKEGAYVVHSKGGEKEHHDSLVHHLKKIGNEHKQESVMHVKPSGEASYHHLDRSDKKGSEQHLGKMHYNRPLKQGGGNTQMKKGGHSFTVQ
jgi:hypothetical protein